MVDLERREIIAALVGDEALEAMAVVVGERQVARRGEDARGDRRGGCHAASRARARRARRARRPGPLTLGALLSERRLPGGFIGLEDRRADLQGDPPELGSADFDTTQPLCSGGRFRGLRDARGQRS